MMPGKFKLVVSDLHLSAGHEAEGNLLEDFGSDQEFAALLDEAAAESKRKGADVELIINGDAFEMLQVPHEETFDPTAEYPPERYLSSSEADSILKMNIIIGGHPAFFRALAGFIQVGPPRRSVTFIKGNHDVNIHWAGVQDRIRRAVGAMGQRNPLLTFEERRISREGIYVEHGNQYAESVDRLADMEEPHDHDRPGQLAIPLGSYFVMNVFNKVERDKYWIDGVKPITALVWYALSFDFPFAAKAIATLARALPDILGQTVFAVDEDQAQALALDLEDPAQVEELAARYEEDEVFRAQFNAQVASVLSPTPGLPGAAAFSMTEVPDPVAMGEQVQKRVNSSLYAMAARRAAEEGVQLVTFGHTHDASVEDLPEGGVYINSGTWTWRADFEGEGKDTWQDLFEHPERFTGDRRLSYVRIDYDEAGRPSGQLKEYEPPPTPEPPSPPEVEVDETPEGPVSLWDEVLAQLRALWKQIAG
jgi:UDP-2,3-diacylglucosamine pyrophosphatase LpxH